MKEHGGRSLLTTGVHIILTVDVRHYTLPLLHPLFKVNQSLQPHFAFKEAGKQLEQHMAAPATWLCFALKEEKQTHGHSSFQVHYSPPLLKQNEASGGFAEVAAQYHVVPCGFVGPMPLDPSTCHQHHSGQRRQYQC